MSEIITTSALSTDQVAGIAVKLLGERTGRATDRAHYEFKYAEARKMLSEANVAHERALSAIRDGIVQYRNDNPESFCLEGMNGFLRQHGMDPVVETYYVTANVEITFRIDGADAASDPQDDVERYLTVDIDSSRIDGLETDSLDFTVRDVEISDGS